MSAQENTRIAEMFITAINDRDLNRTRPFEAPNYKFKVNGDPEPAMTADQSRAYTQGFITAFPDLNFEMTEKVAQGNFVVINWIARGTNTGNMRTPSGNIIPPTGKRSAVHGSTTYQFRNGKAVRALVYWDIATMLTQLGLLPPM